MLNSILFGGYKLYGEIKDPLHLKGNWHVVPLINKLRDQWQKHNDTYLCHTIYPGFSPSKPLCFHVRIITVDPNVLRLHHGRTKMHLPMGGQSGTLQVILLIINIVGVWVFLKPKVC